jgi:S-DNA-T family DNA segregation ATPase FtsK/SpoIIIE
MLSEKQSRELLGLALLALALFTTLSLLPAELLGGGRLFASGNLMGMLGNVLRHGGYWLLGVGIPSLPLFPLLAGLVTFGWMRRETAIRWGALVLGAAILLPTAAALFTPNGAGGEGGLLPAGVTGWVGRTLGAPLVGLLGVLGGALVVLFIALALPVATVGWNPARVLARAVAEGWTRFRARRGVAVVAAPAPVVAHALEADDEGNEAFALPFPPEDEFADEEVWTLPFEEPLPEVRAEPVKVVEAARPAAGKKGAAAPLQLEDPGDPASSDRPASALLSEPPPRDVSLSERELDRLGQVLVDTLRTFKVESQIGGRTTGPVVTQFEVVPAPGVKVNRIAALDADLALALRAPSVRIVAPIPGKGAVGVEVPNPTPEVVYLREILESPAFQRGRGPLPLALGKDLTGKPYVSDLARMPHLLIAGATGSGKSVCINTIITSLVYRHSPQTLRLLMVDPKMVELSMYGDLPHLRHPVVTDPNDAAVVLKWAVLEMERRYALLSVNGVRALSEFNQRVADGVPLRRPAPEGEDGDPDRWIYNDGPLPYIVVVVDELADLMMAVQAEIERPLAQLAQKARAIGIHLIVATQRPSVNVITGLIKANFPCRIAFRVSSKVDSRTILDQNGADALLGNGDMLFLPPGTSDPVRVQGAYLSTEDTEQLMAWYREQGRENPELEEDILEVVRAQEAESADDGEEMAPEDRDSLFRQAAEVCIQFQQGSTSLLQRRLRIGYGRAARIIDQLHHAGVLGPPDGSKPREVLVGMESLDHIAG